MSASYTQDVGPATGTWETYLSLEEEYLPELLSTVN